MIKRTELRLYNLVFDAYGEVCKVYELGYGEAILSTAPNGQRYEVLSGIPLTEYRILNLGFEERDNTYSYGGLHISKKFDYWQWLITDESDGIIINKRLQYVHQIQNLYFALTNEETELKEKLV